MALGVGDVIAVIHVSKEVIRWCANYAKEIQRSSEEIQRLQNEIANFQVLLESVQRLIDRSDSDGLPSLHKLEASIHKSKSELEGVRLKLETKSKPEKSRFVRRKRRLEWPFTKEEVDQALERLGKCKNDLNLAVSTDTLHQDMQSRLKIDQAEQSRLLKQLPRAEGAAFNSRKHEHDDYCLADTRLQILDTIKKWELLPTVA